MSKVFSSLEMADAFVEHLTDMHLHPELYASYSTGMKVLDTLIGGIVRNTYVVFAGKGGAGKTALMITAMKALAEGGKKFLFMGLEENVMQTAARVFAAQSGLSRVLFRDIGMQKDDWPRIYKAHDEIAKWQGFWGYGIYEPKKIQEFIDDLQIEIVGLDYLQLMSADRTSGNRAQEVSQISGWCKSLTLREECPVTLLADSQLNEQGLALWSRDIFRDCDTYLTVNDKLDAIGKPYDNCKVIRAEKSRYSKVGEVEVMFSGETSLFKDPKGVGMGETVARDLNKIVNELEPIKKEDTDV